MRKTLKKAVGGLNKACAVLLGIDMVAMFLILLLQIFSRFPYSWERDLPPPPASRSAWRFLWT